MRGSVNLILEGLSSNRVEEASKTKEYRWEDRICVFVDKVENITPEALEKIYKRLKGSVKQSITASHGEFLRKVIEEEIGEFQKYDSFHSRYDKDYKGEGWGLFSVDTYKLAEYIVGRFVKEEGKSYKSKSGIDGFLKKHHGSGDVVFDGKMYYVY